MKLRKGDTVIVVKGSDRGKTGTISAVIPDRDAIVIEGVNVRTVHIKSRMRNEKGKMEKRSLPIAVSNVSYFDEKKKQRTKISYSGVGKEKKRIARSDGSVITGEKKSAKTKKKAVKKTAKKKAVSKTSSAKKKQTRTAAVKKKT